MAFARITGVSLSSMESFTPLVPIHGTGVRASMLARSEIEFPSFPDQDEGRLPEVQDCDLSSSGKFLIGVGNGMWIYCRDPVSRQGTQS